MPRTPFYETEDLDIFFGDFAEDCILNDNAGAIIPCLYDESQAYISSMSNDINGVVITALLKNSDIKTYLIRKNSNITIRDTNFIIKELRKNGSGISEAELEEIII